MPSLALSKSRQAAGFDELPAPQAEMAANAKLGKQKAFVPEEDYSEVRVCYVFQTTQYFRKTVTKWSLSSFPVLGNKKNNRLSRNSKARASKRSMPWKLMHKHQW